MLCKHGTRFGRGCLTSSVLDTLVTPAPSHFWIALIVLLNWLLRTLRHVWVRLIGEVPVSAEPIRMISGGFSATPALYRGIDPTCCLSYILFGHTHVHGRSLPVGNIWAIIDRKWGVFMILPVIIISIMKPPSWRHEYHWQLFPWICIICFCES